VKAVDVDQIGLVAVFVLVGLFLAWFVVGGEYNRRRAGRFAQWVYAGVKPFLGKASIRWLTTHAFEVYVEEARAPFGSIKVTGLLESRDMLAVWLYNRLTYRPDLLMLRANFSQQPGWGCEVFRPGTLLSGDAQQDARAAGWRPHHADGAELQIWHGGGKAADHCARLVNVARASDLELIHLAVRRAEPHLVLAVSAARFQQHEPARLFSLFTRLGEMIQGSP
jgi:hypothetical protein